MIDLTLCVHLTTFHGNMVHGHRDGRTGEVCTRAG